MKIMPCPDAKGIISPKKQSRMGPDNRTHGAYRQRSPIQWKAIMSVEYVPL